MSLGLANAANARDLGGLATAGGHRVRTGLLYRANALNRLSPADVQTVAQLRLACLIDFRHPHEVELTGPDRLPRTPPARVVTLPLFDTEHDVFTTVSAVLAGRAGTEAMAGLQDGGAVTAMCELYRWFVTSTTAGQAFAAAIRLIASADALPLLFHCTAGKDRTGWLAALVLSVLGVDRAAIVADYLRTNELNAPATALVLERLADRVADPPVLLPLLEARLEYLDAAFVAVDEHYGDMVRYLRDGLGLDQVILDAVRANLLDARTPPEVRRGRSS